MRETITNLFKALQITVKKDCQHKDVLAISDSRRGKIVLSSKLSLGQNRLSFL
jgi:hypothetical protein